MASNTSLSQCEYFETFIFGTSYQYSIRLNHGSDEVLVSWVDWEEIIDQIYIIYYISWRSNSFIDVIIIFRLLIFWTSLVHKRTAPFDLTLAFLHKRCMFLIKWATIIFFLISSPFRKRWTSVSKISRYSTTPKNSATLTSLR